jgi:mannosyltransferase OCH1-like enzyme
MKDIGPIVFCFVVIVLLHIVVHTINLKVVESFWNESNPVITIMQTHKYKENNVPPEFKRAMMSWIDQKAFNYKYFDDDQAYNYLLKHFGERHARIFKDINIGAFKSDFFRYCWIYNEGGIYADLDTVCLTDLDMWLRKHHDVDIILTRDDPSNSMAFYQAFIYCKKPKNILMKECIDMIIENVAEYRAGQKFEIFSFTGPSLVYNAFIKLNPQYIGKVPPLGILSTNNGKMLVMSWKDDKIIDNKANIVFQHKCDGCDDKDAWHRQTSVKKWVTP